MLKSTETAVAALESRHVSDVSAMAVNVSWAVRIEAVAEFAKTK